MCVCANVWVRACLFVCVFLYFINGRLWDASVQTLFIVSFCQCCPRKLKKEKNSCCPLLFQSSPCSNFKRVKCTPKPWKKSCSIGSQLSIFSAKAKFHSEPVKLKKRGLKFCCLFSPSELWVKVDYKDILYFLKLLLDFETAFAKFAICVGLKSGNKYGREDWSNDWGLIATLCILHL